MFCQSKKNQYTGMQIVAQRQIACNPYSLSGLDHLHVHTTNEGGLFTVTTENGMEGDEDLFYPEASSNSTSCFDLPGNKTHLALLGHTENLYVVIECVSSVCNFEYNVEFICVDNPDDDDPYDPGVDGVDDDQYADKPDLEEPRMSPQEAAISLVGIVGITIVVSVCFYGVCRYEVEHIRHRRELHLHEMEEHELEEHQKELDRLAKNEIENEGAIELRSPEGALDMRTL
jgi:hypothetical protein